MGHVKIFYLVNYFFFMVILVFECSIGINALSVPPYRLPFLFICKKDCGGLGTLAKHFQSDFSVIWIKNHQIKSFEIHMFNS